MARILNTDDLALAQNLLRSSILAHIDALAKGEPGADPASDIGANVLMIADVLWDCTGSDTADRCTACPHIDAMASAFEAVGYSRELGAIAWRGLGLEARAVTGSERHTAYLRISDMVLHTPEYTRLFEHHRNPVPACCDWEVPAID